MFIRTRAQALIIENGNILLAKHHDLTIDKIYWCLPGGGVEAGESPEEAVVRELKEETNLDIRVVRKIAEMRLPGVTAGYAKGVTFLAEIAGGELSLGFDPEQEHWQDKFLQAVSWRKLDARLLAAVASILRLETERIPYRSPFVS
jgi:ADP-ribose pyrophosphatase YjhB (NUDIX family)